MITAITCDLIKSRRYNVTERQEVDKLIKQAFTETIELIPEAEADKLSFNVIQGDEFQFVINNPSLAYRFVIFYRLILSIKGLKHNFRAGIGFGEVSISNDNSYKMDGSAFHNSRDAYNLFGKSNYNYRITTLRSNIKEIDNQFDLIAMFNDFIEQRWSLKQRKSIYLYEKFGSLKEAAKHESVTLQALQQRIKVSGYIQMDLGFAKHTALVNSKLEP